MLRTSIAIGVGALLCFVLGLGGSYLMAFLVLRNVDSLTEQQILLRLTLGQALVVGPSVAVIVGVSFGWLAQKRCWWLAGATFVPGLIYGLVTDIHGFDVQGIILFTAYVALACLAAFVISRFKQPRLSSGG